MSTTPTSRLLVLLSLLQTRRDWPGQTLADRLAVSGRTVRRDVDRLREMGYRIDAVKGPDGGYRLDAGTHLPPLLFDDDQAVALAVALRAVQGVGAGVEDDALRALTTLRQVLPARLRHRLDAIDFTALRDTGEVQVDPAALEQVSRSIRASEVIRFDYAGGGDERGGRSRRAEPHHLVVADRRWYLVAFDLDRDAWRTFRMDRLTPRPMTGPRFAPRELPGGDARTFVASRFKGRDGVDAWACQGSATLRLPAGEVLPFAGDAVVEPLDDTSCRITLGAWSWVAVAASLLRFDIEVLDVQPAELAEAFGAVAARSVSASAPAG